MTTWWIEEASFNGGIWTVSLSRSNGHSSYKRGRSLARVIEEVTLEALKEEAKGVTFDNERSCMRTIAEGTQ